MSTLKRILLALFGALILGLVAFLVPTLWGRPYSIDHFYMRVFATTLLRHPTILTSLGMDLPVLNARLDDMSMEFEAKETKWAIRQLETLRSYDVSHMSAEQKLSRDVLEAFLADLASAEPFQFHNYPVNQLFGAQSQLPDFMLTLHPLHKASDATHYVERVHRMGVALDQVTAGVRARAARGVVPPRFVLERVLTEMNAFIAPPPRENPLYRRLDHAVDTLKGGEKNSDRLRATLASAIETDVYPAYRRMIGLCDTLKQTAGTDDGVWKLPNGDAYYDWCLRHHTTTTMSADQIHELGLSEVGRIRELMAGILRRQGVKGTDLGARMRALEQQERFHYPASDSSRATIIADYKAILADVDTTVGRMFGARPGGTLDVQRIPEFKEKTSPGAYYQPPTLDGKRPGVFFANLRDPHETVTFDMRTLAFHEGVPGHHFQISLQQELKDVAFFRKVIPFTAYSEGWGLYAERLCLEQGLQRTPFDSLGALRAELMRAARLVVDTGIHRKRWTREQAIRYFVDQGLQPEAGAITEVERYIVIPGQACAYKVGQLEILTLRAHAEAELGDRFDIRRFHDAVLLHGALPLSLLERVVEEWIATEKARPAA